MTAITDAVIAVVEGRWGDLPRYRRKRVRVGAMIGLVWRFVRLTLVGVGPFLAYRFIPGLPFADSPVGPAVCVLWLGVCLMMGLDPALSEKLRVFQDVWGLMRREK